MREVRTNMVYVFLADGFEEIEAVTPIDILLRAGLTVKTVAVGANPVTGAHGIPITADIDIGAVCLDEAKLIILPGGMPGYKKPRKQRRCTHLCTPCI